ncbi:TMV resistance protein N-like isoform X2 [Prosopis cineraria]|uniref:TMV resistance protein N-like isoform X2 n=1 Tax=Prosopis cineraria TaxID=364024 RepID=UPI00240EB07E|nr:TMV resistance protein N-like isoform X2 [Prosopis cineraria]
MGAAASSSSSSKKHEVFLSFRGEDTRRSFTSHLHAALCLRGIETYIDYRLPKGDDISKSLIQAIEDSSIAVVILSKEYASSKWCLNELVKILECKEVNGQLVVPIFYKVEPSHVRNQRGSYEEAFAKHSRQNPEKVDQWRRALFEIASLAGWDSQNWRT